MDINNLEKWYLKNHRMLSFRETKDPYLIWVSEIMLQQTQVESVLPFFERFIAKYPNVETLADASEDALQKDVEGLGYYRRFRNMHKTAKMILEKHSGLFPDTYEQIIELPGIGKYTAGAIMSIAHNKPFSALDGNVIRVLSRYLGIDSNMRQEKNKRVLDNLNQEYIEKAHPSIYSQALMELGAMICRPKNPKCEICPLEEHCVAYERDLTNLIPVLSRLNNKKIYHFITLIIKTEYGIYLRKRDEKLLFGMYEYPQFEAESIHSVLYELESKGIIIELTDENPTQYRHIFTHQIWMMDVYFAKTLSGKLKDWILVDQKRIMEIPMAIAHRKILFFD